jgi:hypothetical protein
MKRLSRKRHGSITEAEVRKRETDFRRKLDGSAVLPLSAGATSATPDIISDLDLSPDEWQIIRLAAEHIETTGADAGSIILPGRPGWFRLDRLAPRSYRFRRSSDVEVAQTMAREVRPRKRAGR